jgi:hypothetical protein
MWCLDLLQEPDNEPLSEEELFQLKSDAGYVSEEDAKRKFRVTS